MNILTSIDKMQSQSRQWRAEGLKIGFVPTMGNLHDGHLKLVEIARQHADRVVVSIFVNPLQFGPNEDFSRYPRTLDADVAGLKQFSVEAVFAPDEQQFYDRERDKMCFVEVPGLSDLHCGASRPKHFRGVTTVVNKLFNIVQPDVAIFGCKDYQQLTIIRQMVKDLSMPIELIGVETIREPDGLAMSSRNQYLSAEQRVLAASLYKCLQNMRSLILQENESFAAICANSITELNGLGFRVDYLQICDAETLQALSQKATQMVILAAVYLGKTRLIDNILV